MNDASPSRIALVTGGGTGVGRAIVTALHGAGWTVAITGRRAGVLEEVAEALGGERVAAIPADIGDPRAVEALFDEVERRFGRLDLLVNNAGTNVPPVPIEEVTFDQWQTILSANLTGAFLCTQGAFRLMKQQNPRGGRIINNGSISASTPRPNSAPYTATKHAIAGLTKATALDGRPFDIACGQIDIGNAASDMTAKMSSGVLQADGRIAPEPTMDPADVARAVVHMASLPPEANILNLTIMATKMPFVGRG
ncbi:SDR family oxidoreductase [Antarcticirhabdus aurantiaca]|uniref:SDR family NAD(P)-dependent oxidoreductase n=1 Tax=Antarcticirhabdus aurantiaca TaxID=2606717 RepID=A0ACD4NKW2_9HYPH|nr:SDR family oxidoreductase [Antarcticirhabdus aurantiaca]WAJ27427.1 SDR family NAD(P)-dependent oxidoreductase [Jeongeuplla avenae]